MWKKIPLSFSALFKKMKADLTKARDIVMLTQEQQEIVDENLKFQKELGWSLGTVCQAVSGYNLSISSVRSASFIRAVKNFQRNNGLTVDGIVGPNTLEEMSKATLSEKDKAIRKVTTPTMGRESSGRYDAMNKDGEYKGKFDEKWMERYGHRHPASKYGLTPTHVGLSLGSLQFTQDGGSLGTYLKACLDKNPEKFKRIIGSTWGKLIEVTNRDGPSGLNSDKLRGPRVKKVPVRDHKGRLKRVDLWEKPWTDKFETLCNDPEFQSVQRQIGVDNYLKPVLGFLKEHNLMSEKMVAAMFSASIHRGSSGSIDFVEDKVEDSDKKTLRNMADADDRYEHILNDDELGWNKWSGWNFDI